MADSPGRRWCMVRRQQATWAVGLLLGAGWAVFEGPVAPAIRPRTTWGVPARPQGLAGLVGAVILMGVGARRRKGGGDRWTIGIEMCIWSTRLRR